MNDNKPPRVYEVDTETQELLEEVLSYSETLADCQLDEEDRDYIRSRNRELGERFGLEYTEVYIETDEDAEGNPRLTVKTNHVERTSKRKKRDNILKLVSDNGDKVKDGAPELADKDDDPGVGC